MPVAGLERLGSLDDEVAEIAAQIEVPHDTSASLLTRLARTNIRAAVDLLYTAADFRHRTEAELGALGDLAEQVVGYLSIVEAEQPGISDEQRYPWLAAADDDYTFVQLLNRASAEFGTNPSAPTEYETLGGDNSSPAVRVLRKGLDRLRRELIGRPTTAITDRLREFAGRKISLLFGDVATYLAHRGAYDNPGKIPSVVIDALHKAATTAHAGEPLVVIAHSMGGNIVYDILTYYQPNLEVDVLVTVGSQVGLFEELKLFRSSRGDLPNAELPKVSVPSNVGHWINVVDRADLLCYRTEPIFDRVNDYDYPSNNLWAHTAYFRQPNFHQRLAQRVQEVMRS